MTGTFLNFFQLEFSKTEINIKRIPYTNYNNKELFLELKKNNSDFIFYRDRNWIYYWSIIPQVRDEIGGEIINVSLNNNPYIFSRVIEIGIIDKLKTVDSLSVFKVKYSNTWKIINDTDLLKKSIQGLISKKYTELNCVYYGDNPYKVALCISSGIQNQITLTRTELKNRGIEIDDLKGNDDIIFANTESMKRFLEATGTEKLYSERISEHESVFEHCQRIFKLTDWINKRKEEIKLPDSLKILAIEKKYLPYKNNAIQEDIIPTPKYFFYSEQMGSGKISDRIKKLKPYAYEDYQTRKIRIGVLAPKENEGSLDIFIKKIDSILKQVFYMNSIEYTFQYADNLNLEAYSKALYNFDFKILDLVIVAISNEHKKLPTKKDPYFFCKAKLLGQNIPTQEIQIHNIKKINDYILDNITLNMYTKIGGTPWTIEKEDKLKNELVIGIASTIDESKNTILGIAQIFNYNGKYLVTECAPLSSFENYSENLETYLKNHIVKLTEKSHSEVRLIFHLFKKPSARYELKAIETIERVINNLALPKLSFALVHLGYGHNFRVYANDGNSENKKGSFIKIDNQRGLLIINSKSTTPLLIEIDKRSNFKDLYYISKQIFSFSHLSFKSYSPSKKTVTLLYPNLLAGLTTKLKTVEGWDYKLLNNMGNKLWFI